MAEANLEFKWPVSWIWDLSTSVIPCNRVTFQMKGEEGAWETKTLETLPQSLGRGPNCPTYLEECTILRELDLASLNTETGTLRLSIHICFSPNSCF